MITTEQQAASNAFHEIGSALVALGRRLSIAGKLVALGRQLSRVSARDLEDDKLTALRRPVDDLRVLVDEVATFAADLRTLLEALAAVVGVDN